MARIVIVTLMLLTSVLTARAHADRDLDRLYEKSTLQVGNKKIEAYVADDQAKRAQGLMMIEKLKPDTGMIFVFESPQPMGFWMKDTLIPLSIGFFNEKGVLFDIQEMKVSDTLMSLDTPVYRSSGPAIFALEMPTGWFKKNAISKGAKLKAIKTGKSELLKHHLKTK